MINGKKVLITKYPKPFMIPWQQNGVEIVVESSGQFKNRLSLKGHLLNGVNKVILSGPAQDDSIDRTVVMGVNHHEISSTDLIISNSSCTTNCVAMMLKVLKEEFGIKRAFMNTVHPFTNSQNLQDGFHTDFRRARAAINNIIPTTTSAIKVTPLVIPDMKNIFDGFATRVPVADCSFVELTAQLATKVTVQSVNGVFQKYAKNQLKNYLEYCVDPIVSSDITDNLHSAVFDSLATKVLVDDLIQIIAWYDNESGYSARIIDLIKYISK
jgi:glyceraldehyde 3-phosphate dehydrogenase